MANGVKVLLSVGMGAWPLGGPRPEHFWRYVDRMEALGLDSIWLSDRVVSQTASAAPILDPLIALAGAAARTRALKLGTSIYVLPLRNPVVAAKEMATLDFLSGGRFLVAVGVGDEDERAYTACGVPKSERGGRLDEAIPLLRRLWREDEVTHHSRYFHLDDITIVPKPLGPMPIWLGGRSEAALRRIGRLCDGWLPSTTTPDEIADGIRQIQHFAAEADREVEEDHFGAVLGVCVADSRADALRLADPYLFRRRADQPPELFAVLGSLDECRADLERYIAAGASKFVMRPACPPELLDEQLDALGELQRLFV
jgi:probable F420-dependent oxidoreductase